MSLSRRDLLKGVAGVSIAASTIGIFASMFELLGRDKSDEIEVFLKKVKAVFAFRGSAEESEYQVYDDSRLIREIFQAELISLENQYDYLKYFLNLFGRILLSGKYEKDKTKQGMSLEDLSIRDVVPSIDFSIGRDLQSDYKVTWRENEGIQIEFFGDRLPQEITNDLAEWKTAKIARILSSDTQLRGLSDTTLTFRLSYKDLGEQDEDLVVKGYVVEYRLNIFEDKCMLEEKHTLDIDYHEVKGNLALKISRDIYSEKVKMVYEIDHEIFESLRSSQENNNEVEIIKRYITRVLQILFSEV